MKKLRRKTNSFGSLRVGKIYCDTQFSNISCSIRSVGEVEAVGVSRKDSGEGIQLKPLLAFLCGEEFLKWKMENGKWILRHSEGFSPKNPIPVILSHKVPKNPAYCILLTSAKGWILRFAQYDGRNAQSDEKMLSMTQEKFTSRDKCPHGQEREHSYLSFGERHASRGRKAEPCPFIASRSREDVPKGQERVLLIKPSLSTTLTSPPREIAMPKLQRLEAAYD